MFRSVRARLTWWYSIVLALVLLAFAIATSVFFEHTLSKRSDDQLAEMTGAFAETLRAEQSDIGDTGKIQAAASEAIREFRFRDHQFYVFDDNLELIGSTAELESSLKTRTASASPSLPMSFLLPLARTATVKGHALATFRQKGEALRAYAEPAQIGSHHEVVVVARSLRSQEGMITDFQEGLFIAIPLALLLAGAGGYFLARKSLAPVMGMSERVTQMSAANLKERLPVVNANDELGRLANVFNDLLARLDQSFEQQRRFMADASHELRTPIAILRGESEVALSQAERSEGDYRESLTIVNDEAQRLSHIVEDLFTLARADAGQYPLHIKKHSLEELVHDCVRSVRTLAQRHHVSVQLDPMPEMPIRCDGQLLSRMCVNLLDNAIKFTRPGTSVKVSCERRNNEYVLTVSDTGAGIRMEDQGHIFERFFRVDKARSRSEDGSGAGLGLPIARWIAEAHHGRLELQRSDSTGSTFAVYLPVENSTTPDEG